MQIKKPHQEYSWGNLDAYACHLPSVWNRMNLKQWGGTTTAGFRQSGIAEKLDDVLLGELNAYVMATAPCPRID